MKLSPFIKYWIRWLIQIPSLYLPGDDPHILIFASRRGGSTLFRNMIYSQPGFNYADQPFDFTHRQFNPYRHLLPSSDPGQLISLANGDEKLVKDYLNKVLSRKAIVRSQWQILSSDYQWVWNRYVVKIVNAKPLINWFHENFMETAKVVYLSRHPVPTAISTILRGWETYINTFLEDKKFVEQYLTKEAVDIMQTVEKEGSLLEKQVVNWCLENLVPLRSWKTKDWFSISYEHIISEPIQASRQICNRLGLSDPQKMSTVVSIPSQSASDSLKKSINKIDPRIRLEKWMSTVDPDTLNRIQSILDAFEIELYNVSSPYPLFSFRKDG